MFAATRLHLALEARNAAPIPADIPLLQDASVP